jgi:hypothetical protein
VIYLIIILRTEIMVMNIFKDLPLVVLVCDIDIDSVSVSVEQIHNTIALGLK